MANYSKKAKVTQLINAKKILSGNASNTDSWFGTSYTINLYRGCTHGCIYCDSRSKCYQIKNFDNIEVKQNAIELLHKELRSKKKRGTIGFGSMNDCYMPLEKEYKLTRKALELALHHRFPVHIITKGTLVTRDIDILKQISKIYAAVSVTITAANDRLGKTIEPNAPLSSERFAVIKQLNDAGIYSGITLMPVLPFITDAPGNIEQIVAKAKKSGAKYITAGFGMTLREGNREYYYKQLDLHYPELRQKYITTFGERYNCYNQNYKQLHHLFKQLCKSAGIATKMNFYSPEQDSQASLF